jgi:general secretion pathway protein G
MQKRAPSQTGFTMIELIVVMAILGLLLSLAVPRYLDSLERGKSQIEAHDLTQMRKAIDQFYGDRGSYPEQLEDLVTYRYLRALPLNPHTEALDWVVVPPPNGQKGGVYDVRSSYTPSQPAQADALPVDAEATPPAVAGSDAQP